MDKQNWQRAKALFVELLELHESQRDAFLAKHVDENDTVKAMLDMLMDGDNISQQEHSVSKVIGSEASELLSEQIEPQSGSVIAEYQIENVIGEGGMGTVYKAVRKDAQFEQTVAIKIIQASALAKQTIERFQQERQILASLQHPNIAQLIGGGETDATLPYIIMEYIDGINIVDYCKQHKLDTEARLDLFKQVMSAVSYAHQNLVIHRDIKPNNVLVDKHGVVKLLDFGIAKLIEEKALPEDQNLTAFEVKILTPANASPEQVKREKVTTRTDVYGLSTLLYQMLTEQTLFDTSSATSHEIESWIVDKAPTKPSESISPEHSTKNIHLKSTLSGDIDTIILKGLQKDPERRYSSVEKFAQDIQCYLSNYPIHAKPDSNVYKLKKFYQRNKAFTLVNGLFAVCLLSFTATVSYQAVIIDNARVEALREANHARQISQFLTDTFEAANPYYSGDIQVTPLDLVDRARQKIAQTDTDDTLKLRLIITIAEVYKSIGNLEKSGELVTEANQLLTAFDKEPELERFQLDMLATQISLEVDDASQANEANLALLTKIERYANEQSGVNDKYETSTNIDEILLNGLLTQASILNRLGDYEGALEQTERALQILSKNESRFAPYLSEAYSRMGHAHRRLLNYEESAQWLTKSIEYTKAQYGDGNLDTAYAYNQLASTYNYLERWEQAIEMANKGLAIRKALFPNGNAEIAASLGNLANIYSAKGDIERALEYREQSVVETKRALGDKHIYFAATTMALSSLLSDLNRNTEAKSHALTALPIMEKQLNRNSIDLTRPYYLLGKIEYKLANYEEAMTYLLEALDIAKVAEPDGHWLTAEIYQFISLCYFEMSKQSLAMEHKNRAITMYIEIFGQDAKRTEKMKEVLAHVQI